MPQGHCFTQERVCVPATIHPITCSNKRPNMLPSAVNNQLPWHPVSLVETCCLHLCIGIFVVEVSFLV